MKLFFINNDVHYCFINMAQTINLDQKINYKYIFIYYLSKMCNINNRVIETTFDSINLW